MDESKRTSYTLLELQNRYYISKTPPDGGLVRIRKACVAGPETVRVHENPLTCVVSEDGKRWNRTAPLDRSKPLFYCSEGAYGSFRVFQAKSADQLADCLTDNLDGAYSLGRPDPKYIPAVTFMDNVADLITHEMDAAAAAVRDAKDALDSARAALKKAFVVA